MKKVGIINYGLGNLFSIKSACIHTGMNGVLVDEKKEILSCDAIILPGVGAFNMAMEKIKIKKLDILIKEFFKTEKPIIGICLFILSLICLANSCVLFISSLLSFLVCVSIDIGSTILFPSK